MSAALEFPGAHVQLTAQGQFSRDFGQRLGAHQCRAIATEVAFGSVGKLFEKQSGNDEIQQCIAQKLESLVVVRPRTAMRQRGVEQTGITEPVSELPRGPVAGKQGRRRLLRNDDCLVELCHEVNIGNELSLDVVLGVHAVPVRGFLDLDLLPTDALDVFDIPASLE